ncbi:MAG: N-acetylmuramoyl-L-alanine amidase [Myxococcota bacterium]
MLLTRTFSYRLPAALTLGLGLMTGCVVATEDTTEDELLEDEHAAVFVAQDEDLFDRLHPDEDEGWMVTDAFPAPAFNRVGVRFDAHAPVVIQVRTSRDGQSFSEWLDTEVTWSEEGAHNAHVDVDGASTFAQLRLMMPVEARLSFMAVELFNFTPPAPDGVELGLPEETEQGLAATGVAVSRSEWGARATRCTSRHTPNRITVHHTDTPNNDSLSMPARMRQIQNFHMDSRGWCDIAYHFLVGQDGRVYVGRAENLLGAHAGGANTNNAGVSFIGDFDGVAPSQAMMNAGARILRSLKTEYGITLNREKVKGHRQVGTTSTSCPGDVLYSRLQTLIDLALNGGTTTPPATGFCASHSGTLCDGTSLVTCTDGAEVSRTTCQNGCQTMPAGTPDQCRATTTTPPTETSPYSDLQPGDFGYEAAKKLRERGALWGCAAGRFCPGEPVDRATLASLIASLDNTPVSMPSTRLFDDVSSSHWAYAGVQEVAARGIMTTCGNGDFCPTNPVSRAAAAVAFRRSRALDPVEPASATFTDVTSSHWAYGAIERAVDEGWVTGCASNPARYCPSDNLTRLQAAVIAVRVYGL